MVWECMARPPAFWFWSFYFLLWETGHGRKHTSDKAMCQLQPVHTSVLDEDVKIVAEARERERQLGLIKDAGHGQKRSSLSETQNKGC